MSEKIKSVAVYLGSSLDVAQKYKDLVADFGRAMAQAGIRVVYGGATVGTMGILADSVIANKGEIVGVFPHGFGGKREIHAMNIEIRHSALTQMVDVKDFAERKAVMEEMSDCAVILPGSFGTMDELFTFAVNNEIGLNDKLCYVLNFDGYYNGLKLQFEVMHKEGFLPNGARMVMFCDTLEDLLANLV